MAAQLSAAYLLHALPLFSADAGRLLPRLYATGVSPSGDVHLVRSEHRPIPSIVALAVQSDGDARTAT
jgi:hypothetical protein